MTAAKVQRLSRIGASVLLLGEEPTAPAGAVSFQLPGLVIDVDPSRPDLMPSCLIGGLEWAEPSLRQLYGDEAVTALAASARDGSSQATNIPSRHQPAMAVLRRLAEIQWLLTISPIPLDPWLLEVEELLLRHGSGLFYEADNWQQRLTGLLGALIRQPEAARRAMLQPQVAMLVAQALETLGQGAAKFEDMGMSIPDAMIDQDPWPSLLQPQLGLAAGQASTHSGTVDWRDVPSRTVWPGEENLTWEMLLTGDQVRVQVLCRGYPRLKWLVAGPPNPKTLHFDLLVHDQPTPILTGELTQDKDGDWRGEAVGSSDQAETLQLLRDEGYQPQVRVRTSGISDQICRLDGEAYRWLARGIMAMRLHVGSGRDDYREAGIAALNEAHHLWHSADYENQATAVAELLTLVQHDPLDRSWPITCTVAEEVFLQQHAAP